VRLTLDLTQRKPWEMKLGKRPLNLEVAPVCPQRKCKGAWVLSGTILSRVSLDRDSLDFGEAPVHNQPAVRRKVLAVTHVPHRRLGVTVKPPLATVEVAPVNGQPDHYELQIGPMPSLAPRAFQFEVIVDVVTPEGEQLPGVTLPVAGTMQPEVRALPARLMLGPRSVGQVAEAEVVLQVPAGMKWAIDHIETDSPEVTVELTKTKDDTGDQTFCVRQRVTQKGDVASQVRFYIRQGDQMPRPIVMEVSCYGEPEQKIANSNNGKEQP
jgi:hypothetical protein